MRVFGKVVKVSRVLCARSIKPLEGSRWRSRRMREEAALWNFYHLPNGQWIPGEMDQHAASILVHNVQTIAREASAAPAASF
jgi:hypothetical protein